jgi:acid phosphatase type 7
VVTRGTTVHVVLLCLGVGSGLAEICSSDADRWPPPEPGAVADTFPETVPVLVGAGDIAECGASGHEATAALLDAIAGTVFTAGDNAYGDGTASEFARCYDPTWGRHKARTRPSPGNHDYDTKGAVPYYTYFGARAGPEGRGYYSYDLGDWHVASLNSNIDMSVGSPQEAWLRADLAATTKRCTVAYWHHPRFSSSTAHGSQQQTQPLWQALYDHAAEVVIGGHDHTYERFAPQTPAGTADPDRGIRQFVVGTGGKDHYDFGPPLPNSEVRDNTSYGVLKLTLDPGSYSWAFLPAAGGTFADSGRGTCH